jgi:hypothetical protein
MEEVKIDKRTKAYRDSQKVVVVDPGSTATEIQEAVDSLGDEGGTVQLKAGVHMQGESPNYDLCNDPHGIGCREPLEPLASPRIKVQSEPCRKCVWLNADKEVGKNG